MSVQDPPRCYVASPFGFSEAGRFYYDRVLIPMLDRVVTPVDPWALTSASAVEEAGREGRLRSFMLEVGRRNADAIRSSDLLVACLDGQEPDSGTVAELGYAAGLGKLCFGLRSDFRQAGEEGMAVNLQVETFVVESGGSIAASLDALMSTLARAVDGLPRAPSPRPPLRRAPARSNHP
jgi:nucleoside 2-deoxyribosyltransferase